MGTKRNPGDFDCYENAHPDEPMFILLGRDRHAPELVRQWAKMREQSGEAAEKVAEARECAAAMERWHKARAERKELVRRAGQLLTEIEQIFTDAASWNENVRKSYEERIDPDPDGELHRIAAGLRQLLGSEGAQQT